GAGVRGDRRAPADLRGPTARRDLDRRPGPEQLQLPPAGVGHHAVGAAVRPDPGGERGHGPLRLVEALARPGAGNADAVPRRLARGAPVPAPTAAHPLPRPRAARHRLDADARGRELAAAKRVSAGRARGETGPGSADPVSDRE